MNLVSLTLNSKSVKLNSNEAREAQRLYAMKKAGDYIAGDVFNWINACTSDQLKRRTNAIKAFNLN